MDEKTYQQLTAELTRDEKLELVVGLARLGDRDISAVDQYDLNRVCQLALEAIGVDADIEQLAEEMHARIRAEYER